MMIYATQKTIGTLTIHEPTTYDDPSQDYTCRHAVSVEPGVYPIHAYYRDGRVEGGWAYADLGKCEIVSSFTRNRIGAHTSDQIDHRVGWRVDASAKIGAFATYTPGGFDRPVTDEWDDDLRS